MIIALIWLLSMVSCLTLTTDRGTKDQSGQEAVTTDTGPDEFVKVKGNIQREKILLSNKIRSVAADDNNVWVATDRGVSRFSRNEERWIHYTQSEGLVSDDVLTVALDGELVWFATSDGVSQYDTSSDKWKIFKRKEGLSSDNVQCIAVDGNYVWFGTDSGINRYDKRIDSWALRSKKDGLSTNNIQTIAVESEYVWVGTQPDKERGGGDFWYRGPRGRGKPGAGVNRYHRTTDSWNTYSKADGLADDQLTTIAVGEAEVWFGTRDDGVSLYSKTDQTFVKSYTKTDVLSSDKINSIAVDGGQIWFGTANAGAQRYLKAVNTWVEYTTEDGLASNNIAWVAVHGNEVWFATYESGLSKYDKVSNQWTTYVEADSLADDDLKVVKADSEGNIWIGTGLGLSVYDPDNGEWVNYRRKDGLVTDYIMDVEINNGSIWLGTSRGVGFMDEDTRKWKFYNSNDGLSGDFVTSLEHTGKDMWAGAQGGIFRFNLDENKWIDVGTDFGLSDRLITDLAFDGGSYLWIGTDDGIWRYQIGNGDATHYGTDDGLAGKYVNSICIVSKDLVYAGTQVGLYAYKNGFVADAKYNFVADAKYNVWEKVTLELPSENIRVLTLDDKLLWLGTMSGLVKYDWEQNKAEAIDIGEGLSHRSVRSICIKDDSLWLGTTSGLLQVSRADGSLIEEYRTSLVKEPLREPNVSNIEFDGDYVWFGNWSASPNGAIVRYNRETKTWRRFTRVDILRDTKVRAPTQVKRILVTDDYVWFSTDYGILRYDKLLDTWKHYTMEDGLALNDLRYIVESAKSIWTTSTSVTNVSRYDKESEEWEVIDIPSVPGRRVDFGWIEYIEADGPDVWFGFWSRLCGVRRYNEDEDKWYFYTSKEGMSETSAGWIGIDDDRVWVSHGYEASVPLSYYEKSTGKWTMLGSDTIQGAAQKIVIGDKSVWIIVDMPNRNDGIVRYDKVNDEWTMVSRQDVRDVVEDGDYVWAATWRTGIRQFHIGSRTWTNFSDRTGLLHNWINDRSLKADERFVWAGTPRGLSIYDKESEMWTSYVQPEPLIGNEVRSVVADERYVWCGTSQGLSRYDKLYGTWTSFRKRGGHQFISVGREHWQSWEWWEPEDEDSLVNNDINSLAIDDRYLWVGTKEGASRYDRIADRWDRYTRDTGLPNEDVVAVVVDGYDVWAGTGGGLCKYPRMSDDPNAWVTYTSGMEIKPMVVSEEFAKSLISDEIWSLAADGKYVWVGTRIGLSRYDKGRDTWMSFTQEDGLASDAVSSIAVEDGRIWFGSDNGVTMFDKNTNDWTILSTNEGLSSDRITCIASDVDSIWFGTFDAGVARYNTKTKEWETYSKKDGLAHNSVLSIALDGDLVWFGTSRGLSRYDKITDVWTTFTQFYGPEDK
jgi:ligand-binding sensor domain-containing protein